MRARSAALAIGLVASSIATACGSDDSSGGPPGMVGGSNGGGQSGTGASGGAPSQKCKKLCCADADCASGEHCEPFDPAKSGSLGTCLPGSGSGGAAGTAGADGDGGLAGAGGGAEGGVALPEGCWTGATAPSCHPLTNAGCASGEACDYGTNAAGNNAIFCFPAPNTLELGAECDAKAGPVWCLPGLHCTALD